MQYTSREGQLAKNATIETGAQAVAEDFLLPGGRRKSIAKLVRDNLSWFDAAEARGMFVEDMLQTLTIVGATYADGTSINFSTLSNALWRVRSNGAVGQPNKNAIAQRSDQATRLRSRYETGAPGRTSRDAKRPKTRKLKEQQDLDMISRDAVYKGSLSGKPNVTSRAAGGEHADILARLSRTTTARRAAPSALRTTRL
jgi:hypothetical protein